MLMATASPMNANLIAMATAARIGRMSADSDLLTRFAATEFFIPHNWA
jgi:hypothetical protein